MADMGDGLTGFVQRLQADPADDAAQRELHERSRARLVGFCRSRLDDPNDIEDCVQDVFQDVFAGIGELREPQAFDGWMFTIARRKIGHYNSRTDPATRPDSGEANIPDLPDPVADVEHEVRMRELLGTVSDAIGSLQHPLDEVMRAFIIAGGLRGSELAPRFGWDAKKADHELNRARTGLFAALETLIVVRTGRAACTQLNELCAEQRVGASRKTRLSRDQRRNIHRHITQCIICQPMAHAARDRGRWALGPGIAQLAEYLNRRRRGSRLVAAIAVIGLVALPATSDWVPPGQSPERNAVALPPAPPPSAPTPTPTPTASTPTAEPEPPPAQQSPDVAPPAPTETDDSEEPPSTPAPPSTPPQSRTPPPPTTPAPSPTVPSTSPTASPRCTTTIALNPLTVRVNAVLLCISVSVGG